MFYQVRIAFVSAVVALCMSAGPNFAADRERLLMDANWRFTLNDPQGATEQFAYPEIRNLAKASTRDADAEQQLAAGRTDPVATNLGASVSYVQAGFDDSAWRQLDLPHDWVVELPFNEKGANDHGSHEIGNGLGNTIGWYRRSFELPETDRGRVISVEFDGVFRNSVAWLNGHCMGRNLSGYSSFSYDLSKYANFGGKNELVVRVDASRTEGWFYEGAGIYRHVWLSKTAPVHVAHWGTFVQSQVQGDLNVQNSAQSHDATLLITASVVNDGEQSADCNVSTTIVDADGKELASISGPSATIDAHQHSDWSPRMTLPGVHLWSIEQPYLYKMVTRVMRDGQVVDSYSTPFGVRTLRYDADQGFFLNGVRVEIKGTCNHQDHAGVGSALPDALQDFRIRKLKEMGANALRTSHNDPTPELLDACDRQGMLVLDEHRQMGADPEHLGQLTRLIMRDRNHPCVFMWSLGNEENGIQGTAGGASICKTMQDLAHQLDPSRFCTVAMNGNWGRGITTVIDVQGFNYNDNGIDAIHSRFEKLPEIGTEVASTLSTRGEYANDAKNSFMSAYDLNAPRWGNTAEQWWTVYDKRPFVMGGFVWTGFDYRGEPTPYKWPAVSSQFGIMDTCGFPKDIYYYYQAWWSDKPVLHILPHWNWAGQEGNTVDVWCFSNADAVELFVNGKSVGKKDMPRDSHLSWKAPYEKGTLEARGYKGEQVILTTKVETTGAPSRVVLTPDRSAISADGRDCAVVTVAVVDDQGRIVPTANNDIHFAGGKIIGVGNGDPASHEPDKADHRRAFNGLCQVIVQSEKSGGSIHLTATADGLQGGSADITVTPSKSDVTEVP